MIDAVRGTTVHFKVTFYDAAGDKVQTNVATLSINFQQSSARVTEQYAMVFDPTDVSYSYDWETSANPDIEPCSVTWSVVSDITSPPVYANEGCFSLLANAANLGE